jgi:hypothetical protein
VPRFRTSGSATSGAAAAIVGWVPLSRSELEVGVPAERADAQAAVGVRPVVSQAGHVVDVDDHLRGGEAQLHHRHQALAAGQHLGVVAAVGSRPIASSRECGAS